MPSNKNPKSVVNPTAGKIATGTIGNSSVGTSGVQSVTINNQIVSPGGSSGQVQTNSSGSFAGSAVTYDGVTFVFPTTFRMKNGANIGTLTWSPTATRAITMPDTSDTLVGRATTDTLTNKTINGANNTIVIRLANDVSGTLGIPNGGTGLTALPGSANEFMYNNGSTFATSPNVKYVSSKLQLATALQYLNGGITGDLAWAPTTSNRTLTLPDTTDTLVARSTIDTLANKTLSSPIISGTPTFTATSVQTTGNARYKVYSDIVSLQTTNATVADAFTWTITDECVTTVCVEAMAIKSDGSKTASYARRLRIKRDGGAVTLSTVNDLFTDQDVSFECDVSIDNSSATGRVRVTGIAATTIDWGMTITRQELTHA